jgi:hypothetical protein
MNRIFLSLALLSCIGQANASGPVLSATAYGRITFGERLERIERTLRETAPPITDPDENQCRQIEFRAYPGVIFMVEAGVVTRAESSKAVRTSLGMTVGASITDLQKKYPSIVVEPHQYEPDGHYLTFATRDSKAAIVMEETDGKVTSIRGGLNPSVKYVEGCL